MCADKRAGSSSSEPWLHLAVQHLARRDRTVAQVERFLRDRGASPVQVRQTIGRLSALRYLNDKAYAQRWIENRLARHPMGRERLKAELQAKGVAETVAESALRQAFRVVDEAALARRLLKARQEQGRRLTAIRALRLLRQRGFDEEIIERMMGPGPEYGESEI